MAYRITLQKQYTNKNNPTLAQFKQWIKHTLSSHVLDAEITVRIVGREEAKLLNNTYRHKDYATNVLSFPYELTQNYILGDIILCAPVIEEEAKTQQQESLTYWAHLTIHGILHLLGYDHIKGADALRM